MRQPPRPHCVLWTLVALLLFASQAAVAQSTDVNAASACTADDRKAFLNAANDGVPAEELVAEFAHCADAVDAAKVAVDGAPSKVITVNNALASTFYEQMNGCGYHPQIGVAACDVEIKQPVGYGPPGPPPAGSFQFVDFCFFCGGGGPILVPGSVHVTDDTTGVAPSWGMMAFAAVPQVCGFPAGSGAPFTIRATLSWGIPAIAPCTATPTMTWGNQITFDTRDDP